MTSLSYTHLVSAFSLRYAPGVSNILQNVLLRNWTLGPGVDTA